MSPRKALPVAAVVLCAAAAFAQTTSSGATKPQAADTAQAATVAAPAASQQVEGGTPTYIRPETPEQRKLRVGNIDPGPNPDPKTIFYRYGKLYHIEKFDRAWEATDRADPGWVRPFKWVNMPFEIYQQNEKYVWVWMKEPDQASDEPALGKSEQGEETIGGWTKPQIEYLRSAAADFKEISVPDSPKTIRFEESSSGLPTDGSWRNSLAVADMNGDGFLDIIAPPQRGVAGGLPYIFLGDGKGNWKQWTGLVWPYHIDYGSVAAADFNGDGKMDLAFGIHLTGICVWLGDGKGHFTDSSTGLPTHKFPTRRVIVADLNHDGAPDLLAINEGPTAAAEVSGSKVLAFINTKKAAEWQSIDAAEAKHILGGDDLAVGNFNGDVYPDFVGSSVFFQASELIYLSQGPKKWEPISNNADGSVVPFLSYYSGLTTGHFSSPKLDDAIMSFNRVWPNVDPNIMTAPPLREMAGLDRVTFVNGKAKRVPIVHFSGNRPILGVASGDFDGDGNLDIVYVPWQPKREFVILLGDGKGGFTRAHLEGITAEMHSNYDVTVADVNGDGRPDIVIAYESDKQTKLGVQNGSIHVFLNRGVVSGAAAAQPKAGSGEAK